MTYSVAKTAFSSFPPFCRMALLAAFLLPVGCAGGRAVDSGPQASSSATDMQGPKDTGAFPNLNIVPKSAAPQFTPDQSRAKLAQLKAVQTSQASPRSAPPPSDASTLSTLAKTHGGETLESIEGKCDPALDPNCK